MKTLFCFLASVVAIFATISCNASKDSTTERLEIIEEIESIDGAWKVVELNNDLVKGESIPTLVLITKEGRIAGSTSCNRLLGKYTYNKETPEKIKFPGLGTTMMACPDATLETSYLKALEAVTELRVRSHGDLEQLVLLNGANEPIIVLEKADSEEQ